MINNNTIVFFLISTLFLGGSVMSPQNITTPTELLEEQQVSIDTDTINSSNEFKQLKDSIILCVNAVEESKRVIYLNEPYIKNMDKKIEKILTKN